MAKHLSIQDQRTEFASFRRRWIFLLSLCFVLFGVLIFRLFWLQKLSHGHYTTLAKQNIIHLHPVEPVRGLVFDRKGRLLAQNIGVTRLEVTPSRTLSLEATLRALTHLVKIDSEDLRLFQRERQRHRRYDAIPLRLQLNEEEIARIALHHHRLPGVSLHTQLIRHYPHGKILSHLLGYVGRISEQELKKLDPSRYEGSVFIGKTGLEQFYEDRLRGHLGYQEVEVDALGREVRILKSHPAQPGFELHLSLDLDLQKVAEQALAGAEGSVVALDPRDGSILAMVSQPGFDPNLFTLGIPQKVYQSLVEDPHKPLYDRAHRGLYPPASTIKPFLALAALDAKVPFTEQSIWDRGEFYLPNSRHIYRDWKPKGHGRVDIYRAIVESCDTYFYHLAQRMGIRLIAEKLEPFGFGQKTGVDLPAERAGILPTPEWKRATQGQVWFPGDTINAAIGQGNWLVTPLQMARAVSCLAMQGDCPTPHLVDHLQHLDGSKIPLSWEKHRILMDERAFDEVESAMIEVVHSGSGTAHYRYGPAPQQVAGKTGTVQLRRIGLERDKDDKKIAKHLRDHSWFIAYAPADDPKIAVAVMVEHRHGEAPTVAGKLIRAYLESPKTSRCSIPAITPLLQPED